MSVTLEQSLKDAKCNCQWGHNPEWMGCDKAVADRAQQIHGAAKNHYDANFSYEAIRRKTLAAVGNPQVGDRYHEMYSFWAFVVHVTDEYVYTLVAGAPCEFPKDGKFNRWTREGFAEGYKDCGLDLADRGKNVDGWYEYAVDNLKMEIRS